MKSELSNLLPPSYVRAFRRTYFMRLATVGIVLAVLVIAAHGALLIPAYLYSHNEVVREQAELDALTQKLSEQGNSDTSKRIASVQSDILYLNQLKTTPKASGAIRGVLQVPHTGVHISGITFTAPASKDQQSGMTVSGIADSRDALRSYVIALGQLPFVSNADLPISAYAKETNISFTITLTGTLTP